MKYILRGELIDKKILAEILQNRFCSFDNSIVRWTYNNKNIKAIDLEQKLIRNYSNKIQTNNIFQNINYNDWLSIFDEGLKKLVY